MLIDFYSYLFLLNNISFRCLDVILDVKVLIGLKVRFISKEVNLLLCNLFGGLLFFKLLYYILKFVWFEV